jgi:hypothetical protein
MELDQKVHPLPMGIHDVLWVALGELGGKSSGSRLPGLDSACRQAMHGRSGLCLGGMAHMRPVSHCDGARCCGRLVGDIQTNGGMFMCYLIKLDKCEGYGFAYQTVQLYV